MRYLGKIISIYMLFLLFCAVPLQPCAPAPPPGSHVSITMESATIIWDAQHRIEHFIRSATFDSDAPDFGFLVPTPGKPELSEITNDGYGLARRIMEPKVVEKDVRGIRTVWLLGAFFAARSRSYDTRRDGWVTAAPPPVRVLESKQVAGYDATVLEADDAAALNKWLKQHGYPASDELKEWFVPYIAEKWKITAFKIAGSGKTTSVKMSFSADRPFFPYREPAKQSTNEQTSNRLLQILLLSNARMEGKLGDGTEWPGRLEWGDRLATADQAKLLRPLNLDPAQFPKLWMNYFIDASSPRPGRDDLFFRESADQTPRVPPPTIVINDRRVPLPMDAVLLVLFIALFVVLQRASRRKQ